MNKSHTTPNMFCLHLKQNVYFLLNRSGKTALKSYIAKNSYIKIYIYSFLAIILEKVNKPLI